MSKSAFKRIIVILLALPVIMATLLPTAYTFWFTGITGSRDKNTDLFVDVADFEYTDPHDIIEGGGLPEHLLDRLEELENRPGVDDEMREKLLEIFGALSQYPPITMSEGALPIYVGLSPEEIFADYPTDVPISEESLIVYFDSDGEVQFVHVKPGAGAINNANELLQFINEHWREVNLVSSVWLPANNYDTFDAPIEYVTGGIPRYFHMYHAGPRGTPPPELPGTWFMVPLDYEWHPQQTYYRNYIVRHNGIYYYAPFTVWNGSTAPNVNSDWRVAPFFSASTNYSPDIIVVNNIGGKDRFFRARQSSSGIEPSEDSCRAGIWQEVTNGWIGRNANQEIKSYYFSHNGYSQNQVVIFGVSPKHKYIYYEAVQPVPPSSEGEPTEPQIVVDGIMQVNTKYWRRYL